METVLLEGAGQRISPIKAYANSGRLLEDLALYNYMSSGDFFSVNVNPDNTSAWKYFYVMYCNARSSCIPRRNILYLSTVACSFLNFGIHQASRTMLRAGKS